MVIVCSAAGQTSFIDNGEVRLGIDGSAGGSIFHFGPSKGRDNLLNHFDKGRFIQQSYYGREDGSLWAGKPWRWNPVQGGGYRGEPARVVEREIDRTRLRVVSTPNHWATGKPVPEARMTSEIELRGPVAHIRFSFRYDGQEEHPPRHQELPAVFTDTRYSRLVRYDGFRPWTGDKLTESVPGWPNESARASENWAAYLDDKGWGLGVYFPGTTELTTYRYKGDGKGGPKGSACSYFAPIRTLSITPGFDFAYDVYLTVGTADEIRERFNALRRADESGDKTTGPDPSVP